jgi:dihydrodipicolinate synthase/N-acetylneuraminate lyase
LTKELLDLRGIITVLNTPFTADDRIDVPSLQKNVQRAVEAGVAGFLVPAIASEVEKLSLAERRQMVQAVLEAAGQRAVVIGGASAPDGPARIAAAGALLEVGCRGILVNIPYQNEAQYTCDVQAVAALQPEFLMLQDWDFAGYGLPVPLIARLFEEIECFRSLKVEVVPAGVKYTQVLETTQQRLHVCGGWAVMQMIEGLDRGVHAFMPTGMHEIYTRIYALYTQGDRPAAIALFNRLLPVLAFSNQHIDISIHFFKRLLYAQGIYATDRVRPPILPFDSYHAALCDDYIRRVAEITERLG